MCKLTKAGEKQLYWIIKMCLQRRKWRETGKGRELQVMLDYEEMGLKDLQLIMKK